ncbi:hypothetical protein D9M70_510270 [compost metagenome]
MAGAVVCIGVLAIDQVDQLGADFQLFQRVGSECIPGAISPGISAGVEEPIFVVGASGGEDVHTDQLMETRRAPTQNQRGEHQVTNAILVFAPMNTTRGRFHVEADVAFNKWQRKAAFDLGPEQ